MLLRIDNLAVNYGAIAALQGVSLAVEAGQIVALVGSNGAGKTTLLRTISGLQRAKSGTITWRDDTTLQGLPPHRIVRLGVCHVPEGRQVFAELSVHDNLQLGAYQRRDHDGIATDTQRMYDLFPVLGERRGQRAGTLSGGEQQMLAIARALMAHPQLLLLDEPSLGLAPLIVRKIFEIIREINRNGTTIFLVEQNARMALGAAHVGYVMQTGRIIKTDEARKLLEDPQVQQAYLGG